MGTEAALALTTWVALAVLLVVSRPLAAAARRMRAAGGPGMVPFELAETEREVQRILRAWGGRGQRAARESLRWDVPLLLAYGTAIAAAGSYVAVRADREGFRALTLLAVLAAVAGVVAAVCDAVEDVVLARHLAGRVTSGSVRLARGAAQVKFALVGGAALVVLVGFGLLQLDG